MATSESRLADSFKPLWLTLTGGAFVSFAGGALTLMYFWSIGGAPIGQAASAEAMAKVVLPTAGLLAMAFMMVWLVPAVASLMFADEKSIAATLQRLFTRREATRMPSTDTAASQGHAESALDEELASDAAPLLSLSELLPRLPAASASFPVDRLRVLSFSLSTVGLGCAAVILYALTADKKATAGWGNYAGSASAALWATSVFGALTLLWWRFNKSTPTGQHGAKQPVGHLLAWFALGFFSSAASPVPLLTLLIIFLKSDLLLESESAATLAFGAIAISLGVVLAYAVSLWALVERSQGKRTKWVFLLAVNAAILGFMVIALGLSSRMLETVMVLASVRVQNAVVTLESEGCELLESMNATGWGYTAGSSKTCVLLDVTIQSTLEPAMQIACWRGSIPKSKTEAVQASTSASTASVVASVSAASQATAAPATIDGASSSVPAAVLASTALMTGPRGTFSMPVKFVRSIWKTGGIAYSSREALCATHLEFQRPSRSAAPAFTASSAK